MSNFKLKRKIYQQFLIKLNSPYESLDIFSDFLLSLKPTILSDKLILNKLSKLNKIYYYFDKYNNTTYNEINEIFDVFDVDKRINAFDTFDSFDDMINYILKICSFHKLKSRNVLIELYNYLSNISIDQQIKLYMIYNDEIMNKNNLNTIREINESIKEIDDFKIDEIINKYMIEDNEVEDDITILDNSSETSEINDDLTNEEKKDIYDEIFMINNKINTIQNKLDEQIDECGIIKINPHEIKENTNDILFIKITLGIYYLMFLYISFFR
jgi:hypothetical protein